MHMDDMNEALSNRSLKDIEEAFRVILGYDIVRGASAAKLELALNRICKALDGDDNIVPSWTYNEIAQHGPADRTYSACASCVLDHLSYWCRSFDERYSAVRP